MAKMPFFQFYPLDWLYDTRICTPQEKALLIDLLCFMWNAPERGILTGLPQDLAQQAHMEWLDFQTLINALARKNVISLTEADGILTLISRRMIREEKARESHRSRQHQYYVSNKKHHADKMLTPNKSEVRSQKLEVIKDKDIYTSFDTFYKFYPRKVGRHAAQAAWKKLNPTKEIEAKIMFSVQAWSKSDQWQDLQFVPHPATFLNQKRWEDEAPTNSQDSYEAIKEKVRQDNERVKRFLSGNSGRNGTGEIIRTPRPELAQREESDLDSGNAGESDSSESDFAGDTFDQD